MRTCLAKLAIVGALILAPLSALRGQEQFPGTSYITPFPAGDVYRIQVYGDAFAEGLLGGLLDALADDARVQLQRKRRPLAGITRPEFDDEMKAEEASKDTVHIAVVMVGYNDRYNMRISPREFAPPGSPPWRTEYGRRVDRLVKMLKKRGTAIYWVGLPIMRMPAMNEPAQAVNDVVREKAYLNGIKYIDITAHFSDEAGNYTPYGPDIAGKQRIVREPDGVLFTGAGYRKLAHFVEREIKRDLTQARSERAIPLAGSEPEQKRIAALRPRPSPDTSWRGSMAPTKEPQGKDAGKAAPKSAAPAPATPSPSTPDGAADSKADHGRIALRTMAASGREETVTLELPRPAIAAPVLQLITRRDNGDRPSQMGDVLADDVGGGLVVLSSVTPVAGPGVPRKAMPGQPYYQVWFKGERLPPRPGRSDDFAWPRAEAEMPVEPPRPAAKAAPRG
jgi:lysophospholipase L1-like esterase